MALAHACTSAAAAKALRGDWNHPHAQAVRNFLKWYCWSCMASNVDGVIMLASGIPSERATPLKYFSDVTKGW